MKYITLLLLFLPSILWAQNEMTENDSTQNYIYKIKDKKYLPAYLPHAIRLDLFEVFLRQPPAYELSYEQPIKERNALQTDFFVTSHQQKKEELSDYNEMKGYGLRLVYKYYQKTRHRNYRYYLGFGLAAKHYYFQKTGEVLIYDENSMYSHSEPKDFEQRHLSYGFSLHNGYLYRFTKKLEVGIDWGVEFRRARLYDNEVENYATKKFISDIPKDYHSITEPAWLVFSVSLGYLW
ncbi:hypothetical protein [Persicobacter sp. CCB-QB2]|uniref:hypothetical protein n=1 Tax=Persicobacter sp. CCB-QB2 TaxID=1561025 RepID=UPI0012FA3EAE|nr:hypothetical protein [Persicobacter sp. CCB-QB2]